MNYPPLMIDVSGLSLTPEEKTNLAKPSVCGVILFGRNYENKPQLIKLVQEIRTINPNLLISVDHEGGRVQRFRQEFTHLPSMTKLGVLFENNQEKGLELAYACGYVLAYELLEVDIDFSFSPVLDINYGHNEVIADRAFSDKPEVIIALSQALINGMKEAGMISVAKHFPGHGFVDVDSHLDLPIDKRMIIQIMPDLSIFRALLPMTEAVMPAHIIYKKCDLKPAVFSKFWLKKILRQKYGYQGVIISDDLSMQGAVKFLPNINDRIKAALEAGCDMVLICNQPEQVTQIIDNHYPSSDRIDTLKHKSKLNKITYQNSLSKIQPLL